MISVVTCVYNRAEQMRRGLTSLINQYGYFEKLELIIVDDGSSDGTHEEAQKLGELCAQKGIDFKYIYLDNPEPRISCIPRNRGIAEASGDIIVFTESECLHVGNTISELINQLKETEKTPVATQVWTMGEKIYKDLPEEVFLNPKMVLEHPYAMLVSGNMQNTNAPDSDWGITGSLNCVVGCLFACRKEWLTEIGGFDEELEGHGWDDWSLFDRLAMIGHGIEHNDEVAVVHMWHPKNYPYNIYEAAERNGTITAEKIKKGIYKVNG